MNKVSLPAELLWRVTAYNVQKVEMISNSEKNKPFNYRNVKK